MCDFWVSQARHYCNYCKVWTSGSKESVRRHEEGARHKDRVAQILKKKRQGPRVPADARNLQKQLADIEAAAAASMGASARGERGAFAGALNAGGLNVSAPAGRGGRPTTWPGMGEAGGHRAPPPREWTGPTWQMPRSADDAEAMEGHRPAGDDDAGEYTVRGVLYFAGERHPDKLRTRGVCEVWLESADAWVPATILKVKRHAKGAEGGEVRTYDVRLLPRDAAPAGPPPAPGPPLDAAPERRVPWHAATAETAAAPPLSRTAAHLAAVARDATLRDLAAADLRVAAVDGAYVPRTVDCDDGADAPPPESVRPAAPIARDEATGLGVWQTVAVRQVDDAAEASAGARRRENADAARDKRDRQRREAAGSIDDRARQMCERAERVEALSSQLGVHDRTDEYRGIKLADDDAAAAERAPQPARDPGAPPPAFKRRKVHAAFRKKKAAV
uniref:Matrin-type domain-containing protein n=1 Tax=Pelagomonas calceolata TaxID=35677 RepID=A0A7S3ZW05_9STRA|mmetsp:Transcript_23286/g.65248  ORF Transcript_23286/g.65248 Transcript_23286/m.65248 type:complete len:447 (-) Transcript_23286:124-1464(-)